MCAPGRCQAIVSHRLFLSPQAPLEGCEPRAGCEAKVALLRQARAGTTSRRGRQASRRPGRQASRRPRRQDRRGPCVPNPQCGTQRLGNATLRDVSGSRRTPAPSRPHQLDGADVRHTGHPHHALPAHGTWVRNTGHLHHHSVGRAWARFERSFSLPEGTDPPAAPTGCGRCPARRTRRREGPAGPTAGRTGSRTAPCACRGGR